MWLIIHITMVLFNFSFDNNLEYFLIQIILIHLVMPIIIYFSIKQLKIL